MPDQLSTADTRVCGKPCGEFVVTVKDSVRYDPPLIEPATCRLDPNHEGACYP